MKSKQAFSTKLIQHRRKMRLTQHQVALEVGVSQSAYNYWESGKHFPNASKLYKLMKVLAIPADDILIP